MKSRRNRLFIGTDLVRIIYGFEINSERDAAALGLVIVRAEVLIERYRGVDRLGIGLADPYPPFFEELKEFAKSDYAGRIQMLYPDRAAEIISFIGLWEQLRAQETIQQISSSITGGISAQEGGQ